MENKYVEFYPVIREGDQLVAKKDAPISEELKQHVIQVLEYYDEDYRISQEGRILIPASLSEDDELIWNYTTKANDPDWLREHSN